MTNRLNLAMAQVQGSPLPDENLITAREFAAKASVMGADMLIFPEMFMALPQQEDSLISVAETTDGHFATSLGEIAKAHQLYIASGFWEKVPGEAHRVRNAVVLFSPQGEILTIYQKLHLFDALSVRESDRMISGEQLPEIIKIKGIHTSFAICYDLRFPELFRNTALRGAELVIIPSAWYAGPLKEDHWLTLLRARAIENTVYIAGVNLTGSLFCGRTTLFDPFGVPKASAGEDTELVVAQISSDRINDVRSKLPTLKHCRKPNLKDFRNP